MIDNKGEKDIDLLELAHKLWDNKRIIIKGSIIGVVVGLIIAFSIPEAYTSSVTFTVDTKTSSSNSVNALASLAGINLAGAESSDLISTDLYPNIIESTPFVKEIFNIKVRDREVNIDTTLYSYLNDNYKQPWWNYVLKVPNLFSELFKSSGNKGENILDNDYYISEEETRILETLIGSYNIDTDIKTGITVFEISTQSSKITAFLADTITSFLQTYIIEQRTKKAKTDLINSEKLYNQSKEEYFKAQERLASFLDSNHSLISARFRTNQEKLQNEVNLAYAVYTQMAQQVQVNKVKVQDYTPVFTILQPAVEPLYPSSPKKKLILAACILLSVLCSSLWVLKKDIWEIIIK